MKDEGRKGRAGDAIAMGHRRTIAHLSATKKIGFTQGFNLKRGLYRTHSVVPLWKTVDESFQLIDLHPVALKMTNV
jgi:hypothetical protein